MNETNNDFSALLTVDPPRIDMPDKVEPSTAGRLRQVQVFTNELADAEKMAVGAEISYRSGLSLDVAEDLAPGLLPQKDPWDKISTIAPVTAKTLLEPAMMISAVPFAEEIAANEEAWTKLHVDAPGAAPWTDRYTWFNSSQNMDLQTKRVFDGIDRAELETYRFAEEQLRDYMKNQGYSDDLLARIEAGEDISPEAEGIENPELLSPLIYRYGMKALKGAVNVSQSETLKLPIQKEKPWMQDYDMRKELYGSGLQSFSADVLGAAPTMAVGALGSMAAGPVGAYAAFSTTTFGMSLNQYEQDPTVNKDRIREAALFNAATQGALETFGLGKVMGAFKPVSSWGKALKSWAVGSLSEGGTEYLQSYPEQTALEYARGLNPNETEDLRKLMRIFASAGFQKDALYQGLVGAAAGGGFGAPGAASNFRQLQREAVAKTASVEMGRKYPEAYERILSSQVEAGVVPQRVFLPAAKLHGLFQEGGITDESISAFLESVGIDPADYSAALDTGAAVSLPFAKIHKLGEHSEALLPHIEMTPEQEYALAQAAPLAETTGKIEETPPLSAEEEAALAETMNAPLVDDGHQEAKAALKQALIESTGQTQTPYSPAQAGVYADIIDALAVTAAARGGGKPLDWYKAFAPEFLGPLATTADLSAALERAGHQPEGADGFHTVSEDEARKQEERRFIRDELGQTLKEREPVLGAVWGQIDGKSLKRDYPTAYKEIVRNHGVGVFSKSGRPIDVVADDLVRANLLQEGMGADDLVEYLKRPREDFKLFQGALSDKAVDYGRRVKKTAVRWAKVVDDFFARRLPAREIMQLGPTPDLLVEADIGIPALPLVMEQGIGRKVTGQDARKLDAEHNLTPEQMKALPEKLADPVMVLRSDRPGGKNFMVVTDMFIGDAPIMVGLYVDELQGRVRVNSITTAYGKNNFGGWLGKENGEAHKGRIAYLNKEKSDSVLSQNKSLPQLARVLERNRLSGNRIVFDADVVKPSLQGEMSDPRILHQANRAVIAFAKDARAIIQFFQSADISSASHEIGHLVRRFLEHSALMETAPQQTRDDWRTACEFVKAQPGEVWTREQEEHFADAFLGYLEKGEAPSKGLRSAFRKLKGWLLKLYQVVRNHGIDVSPEMREVFDRLLATDAEIEHARAQAGAERGVHSALVPESRKARYEKALQRMDDATATEMEKKLLTELSRKQGQWEKEGAKIASERPEHRLLDTLAKEGGLQLTEELKEAVGPDLLAAVKAQRKRPLLKEDGGLDPEIVADEWGWASPLDMLHALATVPTREAIRHEYVQAQTEAWRGEWSGDEVVVTDEFAAVLGEEAGILAELAGRHAVNGQALRRAVEGRLAEIKVENLEAGIASLKAAYHSHAAEARKQISAAYKDGVLAGQMNQGKKDVRDLGRTQRAMGQEAQRIQGQAEDFAYAEGVLAGQMSQGAKDAAQLRRVESQAANEVAKAEAKTARADERLGKERYKRAEQALAAKELQRRTLEELKARYAAKAERDRILKNMRRMAKAGPDVIDTAFGDQIRALLERFDMGGKSLAVKDPERLVPLPRFLAEVQTGIMEEAIPVAEWILSTRALPGKKAGWKQLSLEQLRELHEAVTWIDHMGRTQKQLIGVQEKALVADVAGQCATSMASLKSREAIADYERKSVFKGAKHLLRRALAGITNLEYAFDAADGFRIAGSHGRIDGVHYRHIRGRLMESRRQELTLQANIQQSLEVALAPFRAKQRTRRWDIPDVPLPQNVRAEWGALPWTHEKVIMVALNMGNAGNKKALMKGFGWSETHLRKILASLTAEDARMVQAIWDTVNSLYPALDKTYRTINGLPMKKVQADAVEIGGVVLPGGYFPLVTDHVLSGKAAALVEEEMFKAHADAMFMKPKLTDGFTKGRTGSALPPRLSMDVLTTHLARTVHYITHAVAIRDIVKLTQHPAFAAVFTDKFGAELHEQINSWLRHIARPTQKLMTGWEKGLEYCRFMGTIQGLGLKFGTAAMQLTSMPSSAQEIGWAAMSEGMAFVAMHRSEAYRTIRELSPFMRDRAQSLDRDIAANLDKFNPDRSTLQWEFNGKTYEAGWKEFQEFCYLPTTFTDSITAYSTWWGAYKKKLAETGGDQVHAVDYADGAVIRAQSAAHSMNLTEAQRSTGIMKMCTMFMTFTMNLQNRTRFYARGVMEGQISVGQYSRHVWNDLLLQPMVITMLMGLLKHGEIPDDPWEYLKDAGYSLLSGYPLLRDLQGYMEYGSTPGLVNSLASRGLAEFFKTIKYGAELFTKEERRGDEWEKFIKATANSAAFFRGIPTDPIWTFIDGSRKLVNGETANPLRLFVREGRKKK